jgi:TetR/AcrR family transcriptional repressor of nem operon
MRTKSNQTVETKILDIAQDFVQQRGFNAFSYRDLAEEVGIRTSSIHYYFPTKVDLGRTLIRRYTEQFKQRLSKIDASCEEPQQKLAEFMEVFIQTFDSGNKLCLAEMMTTDLMTLPQSIQEEIKVFFITLETWLTKVLDVGRKRDVFQFQGSPKLLARTMIATLEGSLVAARAFSDEARLVDTAEWLQALVMES